MKIPLVAIIGRANVGKSTLFNALTGRRMAIVEDEVGVTRDRNYITVSRHGFLFTLVDTGGLLGNQESELFHSVRVQAELAIEEADLVIALFDGMHGIHSLDSSVVDLLRRSKKPVLWVVNKCESPAVAAETSDFYTLGIEHIHCVSAAHAVGIHELVAEIKQELTRQQKLIEDISLRPKHPDGEIKVAIVGKPNVGKSTLINKILGRSRLVAADVPGTTRDSIDVELTRDGQDYLLVDTAGLRRPNKVSDQTVERFGNLRSLKSIVRADVVVLILDATQGIPTEQDARIAGLVHERGKGLVIVVNKWDAVEKDNLSISAFEDAIRTVFKFASYAPILFVSALTGKRCPSILQTAKEVYDNINLRIPTAQINKLMSRAFEIKPPPVYHGAPIKLLYVSQISVAPPAFALFVNHPRKMNFSYQRYLKNAIRKEFPFTGTDIKLFVRKRGDAESAAE